MLSWATNIELVLTRVYTAVKIYGTVLLSVVHLIPCK